MIFNQIKIYYNTLLENPLFNQKLDKIFAILGVIFSTVLIIFEHTTNTRVIVGILTIFSCTIWLLIRKNVSLDLNKSGSNYLSKFLIILFFLLFTFSIWFFYFRPNLYERPLIYFISISLMVGIVAIQIAYFQKSLSFIVLFETILIAISVSWSQSFLFPDLLGIDPWWHRMFTLKIMEAHFIPEEYTYSRLPMFHLFIASTSFITGLNYKLTTLLSVSLSQITCNVLFIFLLAKFILNNYKVGLLASLLLVVSNQHIYMSYWLIPNAFASIFIPFFLYILMRMKKMYSLITSVLSILLMIIIILTHSITSMYLAIILFIMWMGLQLVNVSYFKKESLYSLNYPVLFTVSMFSWWTFASHHLSTLGKLIKWGFNRDFFIETPNDLILQNISSIPFIEQLFNIIGSFLFFSLSFIGCLYMISKKYGNNLTLCTVIAGIVPLVLGFFSLVTGHSIIEDRWFYFAQLFLSVPLAVTFFLLSNMFRNQSLCFFLVVCLISIVSFLLILCPTANIDNHKFCSNSAVRCALTTSELQATTTTSIVYDGVIKTDNYFSYVGAFNCNTESFDGELYRMELNQLDGKFILIRKEILEKPFILYSSPYKLNYDLISLFDSLRNSKIYDCGSVYGFFKI